MTHLIMDVCVTAVAPHRQIREAENHEVSVLKTMHQHVLIHIAATVNLTNSIKILLR